MAAECFVMSRGCPMFEKSAPTGSDGLHSVYDQRLGQPVCKRERSQVYRFIMIKVWVNQFVEA